MQVVLSTRNKSKVEQIIAALAGLPIDILGLDEAGIAGQAVEDGETLEDNALKKAVFAQTQKLGCYGLSDDTGIFIDALDGKPGVHTADWLGGKYDAPVKMRLILKELENMENRAATFKTTIALVDPEGFKRFFTGECPGTLLREPRCEPQPQMPYSAIFLPDGSDKVFAQMTPQEENAVSHRGKALQKLYKHLDSEWVGRFYIDEAKIF